MSRVSDRTDTPLPAIRAVTAIAICFVTTVVMLGLNIAALAGVGGT